MIDERHAIGDIETGIDPTEAPQSVEWHIDSDERADWVLAKMAALDAERQTIVSQSAAMLARIDSDLNSFHARFDDQLREYARQKKGKRQSVIFYHGTVVFRRIPGGPHVVNQAAAYEWAWCNAPELITTEQVVTLDTKNYVKRVIDTAEALPGIEITPERESFSIKFPKGDKPDAGE